MNDAFINNAAQITPDSQRVADLDFDDVALYEFVKAKSGKQSFEIPPITEALMLDLIKKIPSTMAIGCDGLSAKVLKLAASALVHPFVALWIFPSQLDVFPRQRKPLKLLLCLKVAPVKTQATIDQFLYYPVLSKILERHVATSLCKHLHSYDLLYNFQSAFRPNHSTETALIKLTDELLFNMDNDMVNGLAFVDFR